MAARNLAPVRALVRELIPIVGSFAPNGSSALDATKVEGLGFSVAYTSTGLYTVTLTDKYHELVSAHANLQLTTGDDKFCQLGVVDLSSKTIQIRVWDISGAAVADVAADAGNRINFTFWLRNTAAVPTHGK